MPVYAHITTYNNFICIIKIIYIQSSGLEVNRDQTEKKLIGANFFLNEPIMLKNTNNLKNNNNNKVVECGLLDFIFNWLVITTTATITTTIIIITIIII